MPCVGEQTTADVVGELNNGTLRAGVHVINFVSGGSESLINVIPEPDTLLLLVVGLAAIATLRRRDEERPASRSSR